MKKLHIEFEPIGRRGSFPEGKSLLDIARGLGIGIAASCGGRGDCHSCLVQVVTGNVNPPTASEQKALSREQIEKGFRLACQVYPAGDCKIYIPTESMTTTQRTQVEGIDVQVPPEPAVKAYHVKLTPPTLSDLEADAERLLSTLNRDHNMKCRKIDFFVLRELSSFLRMHEFECDVVVRGDEIIAVKPLDERNLGLAVDMGTTKVAGYLVELNTGKTLAKKGIINPQISYGEDIISRMACASNSPREREKLRELAVSSVNELAHDLSSEIGIKKEDIVDSVIVGNTAIHHLFLGLPVKQLATAPYVAAVRESVTEKTRELGVDISKGAYIHLLPNIAGFVGADHTAVLLAVDALNLKGRVILIDIGTNTEISLIDKGEITSASCASGPAFESGHIKHGMRAASGAIERVYITDDKVEYETIDGASPAGICGSGILDALAGMYLAGAVDCGGRIQKMPSKVVTRKGEREFVIVEEGDGQKDIVITQGDVRELQLAKAAIRSGIQVLLESKGLTDNDIDRVIIAGAFGSYIGIESAITVGMLPAIPLKRFSQIGNAAGMGAKLALVSIKKREEAEKIAASARYIELASAPFFNETFIQATFLGKYRLRRGKREELNS